MQTIKTVWLFSLLTILWAGSVSAERVATTAGLDGEVLNGKQPIEAAKVYAYDVGTYRLEKVQTDASGKFLFQALPAGVYKVIAFKQGFLPTIEILKRSHAELRQTLKFILSEEKPGDVREAEDYWQVRSQIPADVLRDLQQLEVRQTFTQQTSKGRQLNLAQRSGTFQAEMVASGGVEQLGEGEALHSRTGVGLSGAVGSMDVDVNGSLQRLESGLTGSRAVPEGQAMALGVQIEGQEQSTLSFHAARGETTAPLGAEELPSVELEQYRLNWAGAIGSNSRADLTARYQRESNFYQLGWVHPMDLPEASQTLTLEGTYAHALGQKTSLTTGLSYRQREAQSELSGFGEQGDEQRIGLFGLAGTQIKPRVYVEYGLFSTVNDGNLSLMPHGGMVVQMNSDWQAKGSLSQRVHSRHEDPLSRIFNTAKHGDNSTCQQVGEACYELSFTHSGKDEESISFGAIHREYAETLRIYFNDDFFNRLESVFVVDGDELPEVRFELVRRITPKVLARLESNIATGGGGIFYATDETGYENQVRYLVTSLDTLFQQTSTGVFIAFHHLEQDLKPLNRESEINTAMEMQRLQLMLTQDLSALADISSRWAFRVNMELSRGSTPYRLDTDEEFYKKLTGGISVSF